MHDPPDDGGEGTSSLQDYLDRGGSFLDWKACDRVKKARDGDIDAAREILRDFIGSTVYTHKGERRRHDERTWRGPIHLQYAIYIAEAFELILQSDVGASSTDNAKALKLLALKRSKAGRPKGTRAHPPMKLAAAYWYLSRHLIKPERAMEALRSATGADRTIVQDARDSPECKAFKYRQLFKKKKLREIMGKDLSQKIDLIITADSPS